MSSSQKISSRPLLNGKIRFIILLAISTIVLLGVCAIFLKPEKPQVAEPAIQKGRTESKANVSSANSEKQNAPFPNKEALPTEPKSLLPLAGQNPPQLDPRFKQQMEKDILLQTSRKISTDLASANFYKSMTDERKRLLVDVAAQNEMNFRREVTTRAELGKIITEAEFRQLRATGEGALKSLLSADEYAQYTEHMTSAPDRNLLSQVNSQLALPVDEETSKQLLRIFAEERQTLMQVQPRSSEEFGQAMKAMGERIQGRTTGMNLSSQVQEILQTTLQDLSTPKMKRK